MTKTRIEWTDKVWNPVTGCTKVSSGCKNCYAEAVANRFWAGEKYAYRKFSDVRCHPERLDAPLHWKQPKRVFVNSMSDLFHEKVPFEFIDKVFVIMSQCPQHTFQVLTKRPERMLEYFESLKHPDACFRGEAAAEWLLGVVGWDRWSDGVDKASNFMRSVYNARPNVWLGVSVEDQATANERIPILLETPAAHRFVSCEPLLGPVSIHEKWTMSCLGCGNKGSGGTIPLLHPQDLCNLACVKRGEGPSIDWLIVGAESGPHARPMNIDWLASIVQQCRDAKVPVWVKQDNGPQPGMQGRIPNELWIKEMP